MAIENFFPGQSDLHRRPVIIDNLQTTTSVIKRIALAAKAAAIRVAITLI